MHNPQPHILLGQIFWVTHERALFWEEQGTLIVADLHFGKTGHFRKEGIAIPSRIYTDDLQRLIAMIYHFKAERLIIVGDFTHSVINRELEHFRKWRNDFSGLQIDLVKGNHDILSDDWYRENRITVHEWDLAIGPFGFRHEDKRPRRAELPQVKYIFSGHLHPAVQLKGSGKQKLRLPCFYFSKDRAVLPAFSKFSGSFVISPEPGDVLYAITPQELMRLG